MNDRVRRVVAGLAVLLIVGCNASRPPTTVAPTSMSSASSATPAPAASEAAIATASSTPASAAAFQPSFATAACPADVAEQLVLQATCGFETVLEDRTKPAGRTIQVFVIRIDPPGGTTTGDPILVLGPMGNLDDYGSKANAGQRTHRVEYLVDARGIGHSSPTLDCPEVTAAAPTLAGLRLSDPARQSADLTAVRACHDRLTAQGIDLSAYDVAANAADLEDLRTTLGIPAWNVLTFGSASRIALELSRHHPGTVRSLIVDSPSIPVPSMFEVGARTTDEAIAQLVAMCTAQAPCSRSFPDLGAEIRAAITGLDRQPLGLDVAGTIDAIRLGHPIHVAVDGAALLRWIRWKLGQQGGSQISAIPTTVRAVLDRRVAPTDPIAVDLASDVADCLGVLAVCEHVVAGAVYSTVCRDERVSSTRLLMAIGDRPADAELFHPNAVGFACNAWRVGSADPAPKGSPDPGVPMLALRGVLDPYSASLADVRATDPTSRTLFTVQVPNQTFNALGYNECPRSIRNAWIDDPTTPPDTSCLSGIPEIPLVAP
jgi:pimeloyl-ACP methyl ester carboxylesterase